MNVLEPELLEQARAALASGRLTDDLADEVEALIDSLHQDIGGGGAGPVQILADTRYQRNFIGWCVEKMGIPEHTLRWSINPKFKKHQWDGTKDPLVVIAQALESWTDCGVEAATGTQKTFTGALLVLWFQDCFENSLVVTAAPKEAQLTLHIWKEIGLLWPRFKKFRPHAQIDQLRIRMRPRLPGEEEEGSAKWSAVGFVAGVGADEKVATKAQGFHAEHMLIITEETPGINPAIMAAFENTCTAPHNIRLALGNPDNQFDELHRFAHPGESLAPIEDDEEERDASDRDTAVVAVRISALDHPNVVSDNPNLVPGAVSRKSIRRRARKYGLESPLYGSRVRGISPSEATDALIKMAWLKEALERGRDPSRVHAARALGYRAAGVDVANSDHGDRASIAQGEGALLLEVESWVCPNANAFGATHIYTLMPYIAPNRIGVDSVGVGVGAYNEVVRLGKEIVPINWGLPAVRLLDDEGDPAEERFLNFRSQMHWTFREELRLGEIVLEQWDEEVAQDLVTPLWGTRAGKIYVEAKEELKDRLPGRRSPDKGDAVVIWNWMRKDRQPSGRYGAGLGSTAYYGG